MKTLRDFWISFLAKVVPPDASLTQREECYRAFMSGAASAWKLMQEGVDIDPEVRAFFDRMDRLAKREEAPLGL